MTVATGALVAVASFCAMEGVSYAAHRWLMHGPGMAWHRSHHLPPRGRFERNDRFPLCFSALGVALFALGTTVDGLRPLLWVAIGVTAYGAAYLAVHELVIHRRLPVPVPSTRYLRWLRASHADHHRTSGEPYGMLLPLRSSGPRTSDGDALDRRLVSTRSARIRL